MFLKVSEAGIIGSATAIWETAGSPGESTASAVALSLLNWVSSGSEVNGTDTCVGAGFDIDVGAGVSTAERIFFKFSRGLSVGFFLPFAVLFKKGLSGNAFN